MIVLPVVLPLSNAASACDFDSAWGHPEDWNRFTPDMTCVSPPVSRRRMCVCVSVTPVDKQTKIDDDITLCCWKQY